MIFFETSGVELQWWLPPLITFFIGFIVSTGGLSGAFVLLPFQVSILGFTTPAVTSTNHLYNVISIPSGVYRFFKEKRMLWPLAGVIVAGTLPGVALGSWLRVAHLPDPAAFKLFVGCVLLFISSRMVWEAAMRPVLYKIGWMTPEEKTENKVTITPVTDTTFTFREISFTFSDQCYSVNVPIIFVLSAFVGVIGGAYGVGGGAIIAPFLITVFGLPVYCTAGATLLGTFATSLFAVGFFTWLAPMYAQAATPVSPDWALGGMFGLGGFFGIYLGARLQRFFPQNLIKAVLGIGICTLALRYIIGYFL